LNDLSDLLVLQLFLIKISPPLKISALSAAPGRAFFPLFGGVDASVGDIPSPIGPGLIERELPGITEPFSVLP